MPNKEYKTNKIYFIIPKCYSSGEDYIHDNNKLNKFDNYNNLVIYDVKPFVYAEKTFINIRFSFNQNQLTRNEFNNFMMNLPDINKAWYKYYDPKEGNDEIKLSYEKTI